MQYEPTGLVTYIIYVARWVILAIPGTVFLNLIRKLLPKQNITTAMLISQGVLGALVFFIDRWIFRR